MTDLADIFTAWERGWAVARGIPLADPIDDGLRVRCDQATREIEYFALHADDDPPAIDRLAALVLAERPVTWLTVPTLEPERTVAALERAGLSLVLEAEQLMAVDLSAHPDRALDPRYTSEVSAADDVVEVLIHDASGAQAARGYAGLDADDAVADRILTEEGHRRRGLGGAVMSLLARTSLEQGTRRGLLVASEEGQLLYGALGWRPVAQVVIAANRLA